MRSNSRRARWSLAASSWSAAFRQNAVAEFQHQGLPGAETVRSGTPPRALPPGTSPTWIEIASRLGARLPRGSRAIANDGATTFYKIWTLREAFAKATGLGFMQLVYGRDYFSNTPDTQVWCGPEQHQGWVFGYQLTSATYATAFAMTICNNRLRAVDDTVLSSTSSIVDAARTAWLSISQYCR